MPRHSPEPLPPPLPEVRVPRLLSPSRIASECLLRSHHGLTEEELLPPHPNAILGTITHQAMQSLSRPDAEHSWEVARNAFLTALSEVEELLMQDPRRARLVPLRSAVGPGAWVERLRLLKSWTEHLLHQPAETARPAPSTRPPAHMRAGLREGSEVELLAEGIRLRGRVDRIERNRDGSWLIVDYKTGNFLDDGEPRAEYALQVRLYALMAEEVAPGVDIRLLLEGSSSVEIPWGTEERATTQEWLDNLLARLPADAKVPPSRLAQPGRWCRSCRVRHRCTEYLRLAPDWWTGAGPLGGAPWDVWGEVLEVVAGETGLNAVRLVDKAGRRVLIDGLDTRHGLEPALEGHEVWLFGLESSEAMSSSDNSPRNFHEAPRHPGQRASLQTQVFASPLTCGG